MISISHKVHREEHIHGEYVWVYSTQFKNNIPEFSLQFGRMRKENNITAEKNQSTRSTKLIVKIEEKVIKWRNYALYQEDLKWAQ